MVLNQLVQQKAMKLQPSVVHAFPSVIICPHRRHPYISIVKKNDKILSFRFQLPGKDFSETNDSTYDELKLRYLLSSPDKVSFAA